MGQLILTGMKAWLLRGLSGPLMLILLPQLNQTGGRHELTYQFLLQMQTVQLGRTYGFMLTLMIILLRFISKI